MRDFPTVLSTILGMMECFVFNIPVADEGHVFATPGIKDPKNPN